MGLVREFGNYFNTRRLGLVTGEHVVAAPADRAHVPTIDFNPGMGILVRRLPGEPDHEIRAVSLLPEEPDENERAHDAARRPMAHTQSRADQGAEPVRRVASAARTGST
jgi:hypothetical protein